MNNIIKWVKFTTESGLMASYKIIGNDIRNDVKIKIDTGIPRRYYYSALNEAAAHYDKIIYPEILKNEKNYPCTK